MRHPFSIGVTMAFCAYCATQVAVVSYAPCPSCGNPSNGAPRPALPAGGSNAATLAIVVIVGVVAVVAFGGLLAAIAIPNLLTAMQRSKQKRTMADMRAVSTAIEAYATDKNDYPRADDVAGLTAVLVPTYIGRTPRVDGWTHPLRYECWPTAERCQSYAVGSAGKDGRWEHDSLQDYPKDTATTKFDCDIVFSNGSFVQYPQGVQVR
jgi:type II secretory pathway pseudopilin PulG